MRDSELAYAKTWRVRKYLTDIRKAKEGNRRYPSGLSRLMAESLDEDEARAQAELARRKALEKVFTI